MSSVDVIVQVISAAASGIGFGTIYYKTKNIWSVVFLHAFWDFSIMLGETSTVTSVAMSVKGSAIINLIFGILLAVVELGIIRPFKKDLVNSDPKKGKVIGNGIVLAIIYLVVMMSFGVVDSSKVGEIYKFDKIDFKSTKVTTDNLDTYRIKSIGDDLNGITNYNYSLSYDKDSKALVFSDEVSDDLVELCDDSFYDYILVNDGDKYILGYVYTDDASNHIFKYKFISDSDLVNSKSLLSSVKDNMKTYAVSDVGELVTIEDGDNGDFYVAVKTEDYGYFVLTDENKMSVYTGLNN